MTLEFLVMGAPQNCCHFFRTVTQGKGAYGVVKHCIHIATRRACAVKIISKRSAGHKIKQIHSEVEILQLLRHPNIVELIETFETNEHLFIVLELVAGGELLQRITELQHYSENTAKRIITSLLHAVEFMHNKGVVHRDLKPANLLLSKPAIDSDVKIADFGFSKLVGDESISGFVGTHHFMAPEILMGQTYNKAVDMWSCGVIIFVMLCGVLPFRGKTDEDLLSSIAKGVCYPDAASKKLSVQAKDLIEQLLQRNPDKRARADEAMCHPWIRDGFLSNCDEHLQECIEDLKTFNARVKLKGFVLGVIAAGRVGGGLFDHDAKKEDPEDEAEPSGPQPGEFNIALHLGVKGNMSDSLEPKITESLEIVRTDRSIKKLNFANFNISNNIVFALVKAAGENPSITELDLSCNPLSALAGRAILRLVRQNNNIHTVNLAGTQIPYDVINTINDILRKRPGNFDAMLSASLRHQAQSAMSDGEVPSDSDSPRFMNTTIPPSSTMGALTGILGIASARRSARGRALPGTLTMPPISPSLRAHSMPKQPGSSRTPVNLTRPTRQR